MDGRISLIMMIRLIFVIFLDIKHLVRNRLYQITSTTYVTASTHTITTAGVNATWRVEAEVLRLLGIELEVLQILDVYSLVLIVSLALVLIHDLRISP